MASDTRPQPQARKPCLLSKIEAFQDVVSAAVIIPKEDGVISVSDDRYARLYFPACTVAYSVILSSYMLYTALYGHFCAAGYLALWVQRLVILQPVQFLTVKQDTLNVSADTVT